MYRIETDTFILELSPEIHEQDFASIHGFIKIYHPIYLESKITIDTAFCFKYLISMIF